MTGDWRDMAACAGMGHELFFPERIWAAQDEAFLTCAGCPVVLDCRAAGRALPQDSRIGIWGGLYFSSKHKDGADWAAVRRARAARGPQVDSARIRAVEARKARSAG